MKTVAEALHVGFFLFAVFLCPVGALIGGVGGVITDNMSADNEHASDMGIDGSYLYAIGFDQTGADEHRSVGRLLLAQGLEALSRIAVEVTGVVRDPSLLGYIPEDRRKTGLVLGFEVSENMVLKTFAEEPYTRGGIIRCDGCRVRSMIGTEPPVRVGVGGASVSSSTLREWRNWQTRWLQVPVRETSWGFKSPLAHGKSPAQRWFLGVFAGSRIGP